jgi:hypothetical protein
MLVTDHGSRLSYTLQIYLIPFDGGKARQLSAMDGEIQDFSWSPDGHRLLCAIRKLDLDAVQRPGLTLNKVSLHSRDPRRTTCPKWLLIHARVLLPGSPGVRSLLLQPARRERLWQGACKSSYGCHRRITRGLYNRLDYRAHLSLQSSCNATLCQQLHMHVRAQ